jgi:DNA-binding NarL/FixJ family response regulator
MADPVPEPITVGVVDDHRLFRDGLAALFASIPDIEHVGSATNGEEAVVLAQTTHPDVLLMDLRMPGMNGVEATRRVLAVAPDVAVVMLTMVDDDESVAESLREGARGYVLKDADQHEMLRVIRSAAHGELLLGPRLAARAGSLLGSRPGPYAPPLPQLSERERAVLDLLAAGYDTARISATLHLSAKTVRNYLTVIPRRLGVADRTTAIELARRAGLGHRR